jgi:hypothetical protein
MRREKLIALLILLCSYWAVQAQARMITGEILDSGSHAPVPHATVALYVSNGKNIINYQLTDNKGKFYFRYSLSDVRMVVVITSIGYRQSIKELNLADNEGSVNLGKIWLTQTTADLEEVIVQAYRPPIVFKNNMVEYNANAFRTLPNALVEDLLKKLPGIQVDRNGVITVGGKRVNRITVDEKYFFSNDPKIVSRNLPASAIDRVQVKVDSLDMIENGDATMENVGTTINLQLKKSAKNNLFGRIYGGLGTDKRNELGAAGNLFKDTFQVTVLAFENNINKSGFTQKDMQSLESIGRKSNPAQSPMGGSSTLFAQNNLLQTADDNGIIKSSGVGVNLSYTPTRQSNYYLQYFYGFRQPRLSSTTLMQQFLRDTTISINSANDTRISNRTHNITFGETIRTKSKYDIRFQAGVVFNDRRESLNSNRRTDNNKSPQSNQSTGVKSDLADVSEIKQQLTLSKVFTGNNRRKITLSQTLGISSNEQETVSDYRTDYLNGAQPYIYRQLIQQTFPRSSLVADLNYFNPISAYTVLRIGNMIELSKEKNGFKSFEANPALVTDSFFNILSSNIERKNIKNTVGTALLINKGDISFTGGIKLQSQQLGIEYGKKYTTHLFNVLPHVMFGWKRNSFSYNYDIGIPDASYLLPVSDSSNPFVIRRGNPDLKPSKRHRLNLTLNKINTKKWIYYSLNFGTGFTNNDVVLNRKVSPDGISITSPLNVNGTFNIYSNGEFGKDFKQNSKLVYSVVFKQSLFFSRKKVYVNDLEGIQQSYQFSPTINLGMSIPGKFEFNFNYELKYNINRYSERAFTNTTILDESYSTDVSLVANENFVATLYCSYTNFKLSTRPDRIDRLLVNGSLSYLFLGKKAELKLTIFDILNRNTSIARFSSQNFVSDINTVVLKRFLMLTALYNFKVTHHKKIKVVTSQ